MSSYLSGKEIDTCPEEEVPLRSHMMTDYELITESSLYVNEKVAENLGITVEDDLKNSAVETYDSISEN